MPEGRKTGVDYALELDALGWNVMPAPKGGKLPSVKWQPYQTKRTTERLRSWFSGNRRNYFIVTGRISQLCVLDVDSPEADAYWRSRIGDAMERTTCVETSSGHHYYFRLPDYSGEIRGRAKHDDATNMHWDFRCEGGGVIAPPSIHESGREYAWLRDPSHLQEAPESLLRPDRSTEGDSATNVRSMLARLLASPPAEGGRNDWMAKVAGHYAKAHRTMRDLYEIECRRANDMLSPPLEDRELLKTINSVWEAEQRKDADPVSSPSAANGFLVRGERCLLTEVVRSNGKDEGTVHELVEWADFDLEALGVVEDEDAQRVYDVLVHRQRHDDARNGLLLARVLSDSRQLSAWLAEFGVAVLPPPGDRRQAHGARLLRYLEAQKPQHFQVVDSLGWHHNGFITHEGIIRQDGLHDFDRYKPNPKLRNWAPYRYGFGDEATAVEVLREVLTFHDETVTSVYGAWWAACFLKPQIHSVTSQFPFMALEAPSESGKTTGFFPLMMQLNGNTQGQVDPTRAALRDWMSAHQSGIVWVDDLSDTAHLMDLLRQATGEGSVAKKGEDRFTQESVQLVAPICISGESLQLAGQKALMDRAVMLEVPSPTARMSVKDPRRRQWDDVVALRTRFPDLTVMAGTLVRLALERVDLVNEIPSLVPEAGGRWGDKIAIIRMGARLLADICGDQVYVERVEAWCGEQESVGSENTLTMKLLPQALAQTGWQQRPEKADGRWPATPAFIQNGIVWFSPQHLARWWFEMQHGHIEARTETEEALTQQARALGLGGAGGRRRFNLSGDTSRKSIYWCIPNPLSDALLDRSRGGRMSKGGVHPEQHRLSLWAATHPAGLPDAE